MSKTAVSRQPTHRPVKTQVAVAESTAQGSVWTLGWRIALPVVSFGLLGSGFGWEFGVAPWVTLVGVVIGFGFAPLLVREVCGDAESGAGNQPHG
jgi:F0F1-type ATP synthase assembly protein I